MARKIQMTAIIFFAIGLCLFLIFSDKDFFKNPYSNYKEVIYEENTKSSTINLCVIDKQQFTSTMFMLGGGGHSQYYLILSNEMIVPVDRKEFNKYEIYENYDFEIQQKTKVTKKIVTMDSNTDPKKKEE